MRSNGDKRTDNHVGTGSRRGRRLAARIGVAAVALATAAGLIQVASAASDPPSTYAGTKLTVQQAAQYAYAAGFHTEQQMLDVVAIGIAESGLVTKTRNWHPEFGYRPASDVIGVQGPSSVWSGGRQMHSDRGTWQISSHFWPQYTDAQTDDPATAARIMFTISHNGTDFSPWNTFTGGDAQQYFNGPHDGWPALRPIIDQVIANHGGGTPAPVSPAPQPAPKVTPKPKPKPKPVVQPQPAQPNVSNEIRLPGYVTSYGYYDNNPPGSAAISNPVIHRQAGGTGTYADPITVAVADGSVNGLQFAPGTRFYIPNLRAYFIAEDTIGTYSGSRVHLDVWSGGQSSSQSSAINCEDHITGDYVVIRNPETNYVVVPGPLAANNTCRQNYGDTAVKSGTVSSPAPAVVTPPAPKPQPATPDRSAPSDSSNGTRHPHHHRHHRRHHDSFVRWSDASRCHR